MSEKKEPFDAVINELHGVIGEAEEAGIWDDLIGECKAAIRVLKDWPKWEPLIEAAGKVDKVHCLDKLDFLRRMAGEDKFGFVRYSEDGLAIFPTAQIRALLEALPDKEE